MVVLLNEMRAQFPNRQLFEPVDAASVEVFRRGFGLLMLVEVARFVWNDWISRTYVKPSMHFTWPAFGWIHPWPGAGMHVHFLFLAVAAAALAAGVRPRTAAALLCLGWTYVFLLERSAYLNHLYFACLLAGLFAIVPVEGVSVPRWGLWLLRFQVAVPYLFGGIAKLNGDFLRGQPLHIWMDRMEHLAWVPGHGSLELALFASWTATSFDLAVVPLLLWRRTRPLALTVAVVFHLANAVMFRIGIFPWMMILATTVFLDPNWPRRLRGTPAERIGAKTNPRHRGLVLAFLAVWTTLQCLVPFRHILLPGRVDWTEEAYHFSWRMMLNDKASVCGIVATDPSTGRTFAVDPRRYGLSVQQVDKLVLDPELLRQFCHFVRRVHDRPLEVRATVISSLNGRRPQPLVDPSIDLAAETATWGHARWIVPLHEELPAEPFLEPQPTWPDHVRPRDGPRAHSLPRRHPEIAVGVTPMSHASLAATTRLNVTRKEPSR